jgi:O-antigen chain-terminating methyltransferase
MRSRWASSVGAVTALHVVEHLPFHDVLALIDEALRVLCPGGILILETPNPENLQVAANTFYLDPTHRRPIPPALLQFVAESCGFTDIEVQRLHPRSKEDLLAAGTAAGPDGLNTLLFGPQDYAIVARKPRPAAPD